MTKRILWVGLVAMLALVTAQLQLDRQAAREPAYAHYVLDPFRANAQPAITADAINNQDPATALYEARKLVGRRPVPAQHLTLLAEALYQNDAVEPASRAVQLAAERGWRDPVAQQVRLGLAMEAGDKAEAARRFVALLVLQSGDRSNMAAVGTAIFGSTAPEAENAVVDLLSGTERWHIAFLRRGAATIPPGPFARIVIASLSRKAPLDCKILAEVASDLAKKDAEWADRLQQASDAHCG